VLHNAVVAWNLLHLTAINDATRALTTR